MTHHTRPTVAELSGEGRFVVSAFSNDDAVALGVIAVQTIRERRLSLAVQIDRGGDTVFLAKLGDTGVHNDPWLVGKALVTSRSGESSLLARQRSEEAGHFVEPEADASGQRLAGGSIPLYCEDVLVGTLTMSGEHDTVDHATALASLRRYKASIERTSAA